MNFASASIRLARPEDWLSIREICCKTGNAGKPIDRVRWPFFGELWVGPYQKLLSDWCFVAESDHQILGYLTGCPNSTAFERKKALLFTPSLLLQILVGNFLRNKFPKNNDTRRFVRRSLGIEKGPEACFSEPTHQRLRDEYPAHLHINLDENARGRGLGKQLQETYFEALREKGVPGVHLFCGANPVPFYEKTGFSILKKIVFGAGIPIFLMVKKL